MGKVDEFFNEEILGIFTLLRSGVPFKQYVASSDDDNKNNDRARQLQKVKFFISGDLA